MPVPTRRLAAAFMVWLAATVPSLAQSPDAPRLGSLLGLQRLACPGAVVTGRFADWRAPSRYRSRAGLHNGYDIAMPAGTPALAGWPGQVTRILNWSGAEYGITVVSPSGYETTYGHLRPRVKVGDVLNAGDVVGTVVIDHVDVKMRGPDGGYYDFGGGGADTAAAAPPADPDVVARLAKIEREAGRALESARLREDEATARLAVMERVAARGAVSTAEVDEVRRRLAEAHEAVAQLESCVREARERRLAREARWRAAAPSHEPLPARAEGRDPKRLAQYELLFRRGVISRDELDGERRRQGLNTPGSAALPATPR